LQIPSLSFSFLSSLLLAQKKTHKQQQQPHKNNDARLSCTSVTPQISYPMISLV